MGKSTIPIDDEMIARAQRDGVHIRTPGDLAPEAEDDTATAAALGASYPVYADDAEPDDEPLVEMRLYPGNIPLLEMVDSPLLAADKGTEVQYMDIVLAAYILAVGEDAMAPITSMQMAQARLGKRAKLAEGNPAMYAELLKAEERIAYRQAEFAERALAWYKPRLGTAGLQGVVDCIMQMLIDAFEPLELIPTDGTDKKKAEPTTSNG